MSRSSVVMLSSTQGHLDVVGDRVKADGWYGFTDGLHTVAIKAVNFKGRIYFEASIAQDPIAGDWFPIQVDGLDFMEFPAIGATNFSGTVGKNIIGGFTWLRAKIDRSYLVGLPTDAATTNFCGYVDQILMNN